MTRNEQSLVDCPVCHCKVTIDLINVHLDSNCKSFKKQKTFHSIQQRAFISTDRTKLPFRYFCISLDSNGKPINASFDQRCKGNILFDFSWNSVDKFSKFYLCSEQVSTTCDLTQYSTNKSTKTRVNIAVFLENLLQKNLEKYTNYPLMKSHLQKCIRRMKGRQGILSALHLIRMSPRGHDSFEGIIQLSRRLCIITIEDVSMQHDYPILAWIMVFFTQLQSIHRKNVGAFQCVPIKAIQYMIIFLLEYTSSLCNNFDHHQGEYNAAVNDRSTIQFDRINKLSESKRSIIYSLYLRADYGGMSGDKAMLYQHADYLMKRGFHDMKTIEPSENVKNLIQIISDALLNFDVNKFLPCLEESDWLLAGADFHVCNIATWLRKEMYPEDCVELCNIYNNPPEKTDECVESMIWQCSSSVNARHQECALDEGLNEIWKKYSNTFQKIALYFIKTKSSS